MKKVYIVVPIAFICVFNCAILVSLNVGSDSMISTGFLFGTITFPTSYLLNVIVDKILDNNVPLSLQYLLIGVAGVTNIVILELIHFLLDRRKIVH